MSKHKKPENKTGRFSKLRKKVSSNVNKESIKKTKDFASSSYQESSLGKTLDRANSKYDESMSGFLGPYKAEYYEEPPEPPEENVLVVTDENGEVVLDEDGNPIVGKIIPQVKGTWNCEYFYQPWYKARLYRAIFVLFVFLLISVALFFSPIDKIATTILLALVAYLTINCIFRYYNLAIFGKPMPLIPFLSNLRIVQEEVEEKEEYDSYEELVEDSQDSPKTVDEVENIVNGYPSPATYLTRWMNAYGWTIEDLVEESGGEIDRYRANLLIEDDEKVWKDEETIFSLSKTTGSKPSDWRNALEGWSNGNDLEPGPESEEEQN